MNRLCRPVLVDRIVCATITVMSVLPLTYCEYLAARRGGVVGWRVLAYLAPGLGVGVIVLLLQVALQPGNVVSEGVAIG